MATTTRDAKQERGKPMPPDTKAQHGTRTTYHYACRCDPCDDAALAYQRRWQQARKDEAAAATHEQEAPT